MRRILSTALLLLYCTTLCLAATREHRCMHDAMKVNTSHPLPYSVIAELPTRGQGQWQAYAAATDDEWAPIRIHVSKKDLFNPQKYCAPDSEARPEDLFTGKPSSCDSEDFTDEKRSALLGHTLPAAIKLHTERLSVQSVKGVLKIPEFTDEKCARFTVPESHKTHGVSADFVLYVAAAPGTTFALTCSIDKSTQRPTSGVLNIAPSDIELSRQSIRLAAHEIAHALGFNLQMFKGRVLLEFTHKNAIKEMFYGMAGAETVKAAQTHYGCSSMNYMSFEDNGDKDTVRHSHWERLFAKDELMSMHFGPSGGFYTALTLAAFADLKFYKADMNKAEPMRWGKGLGCDFVDRTKKCMTKGISPFPELFCGTTAPEVSTCTFDRLALGNCPLEKQSGRSSRTGHQYFADNTLTADSSELMGKCAAVKADRFGSCLNSKEEYLPGSVLGPSSRCLKAQNLKVKKENGEDNTIGDICAKVKCEKNSVKVQYKGDSNWHDCNPGSTLVPSADSAFAAGVGHIVCPKYEEVCEHVVPTSDTDTAINESLVQDNAGSGDAGAKPIAVPKEDEKPTNGDALPSNNGGTPPVENPIEKPVAEVPVPSLPVEGPVSIPVVNKPVTSNPGDGQDNIPVINVPGSASANGEDVMPPAADTNSTVESKPTALWSEAEKDGSVVRHLAFLALGILTATAVAC